MLLKIGVGTLVVVALGAMFLSTLAGAFTFSQYASAMGGSNMQVVDAAELMAMHLAGPRAQDYGSDFPQAVVRYWSSVCPEVGGDPTQGCFLNWQSETTCLAHPDWLRQALAKGEPCGLQCVMLVTGAYALANQPLPAAGNAVDFWGLYRGRGGWKELAASPAAQAGTRGLPAPGDIMVWSNQVLAAQPPPAHWVPGPGHVAIVLQVEPPGMGNDGSVTFAEANGPGSVVKQAIAPDLTVRTWPHYTVLGYIRSPLSGSGSNTVGRVARISQLDPAQYDTTAEYSTWAYSACSAAAMTEVVNAYGGHYRIHDILVVEERVGAITPKDGLVDEGGIERTMAQPPFTMQTTWGHTLTLDQVISTANGGTPVVVSFPPDRYQGGHLLIVTGGTADTVLIADSSGHNYQSLARAQFLAWWGGFSAIVTPKNGASLTVPASQYVAVAQAAATAAGISPALFVRQIDVESGFNARALSPAGAEGIAQFMPATAAGLGINPWDPLQALKAAANLMASYSRTYGDYGKALAAYNGGSGRLSAATKRCGVQWLGCLPAETQNYITAIMGGP